MPLSTVPTSGMCSAAVTPGMVSRCSSFRSVGPWGPRGPDSAVAGAAVGNPDFAGSRAAAAAGGAATPYSVQPTPRSPTPLSMRSNSEAGGPGNMRERMDATNPALALHHQVPVQHRLPPTLISSSSLQQRLQRMRVGASARTLGTGAGLESGDMPLHMFNSASGNCLLRPHVSGSTGGLQPAVLEGHASAPVVGMPAAAAAAAAAGPEAAAAAVMQPQAEGPGNSNNAAGRRAGGPAMLTQQEAGEFYMQPLPQQQQRQQQSPDNQYADDQPTPAAEWAALPPRYSRQPQQHSPPNSPRLTQEDQAAGPTRHSDSTNTPNTDGRQDSFGSNTSQHSVHAVRRPVVHFSRPTPPDSPRAAGAASGTGLSPRAHSLTSQSSGSRAVSGVITHGAAGRSLRPMAAGASGRLLPAAPTSAGGSSTNSLPPMGLQMHSIGSSGGGAGAGSSGGGVPPLPNRGKSGRSFERQLSSQQLQQSSPDHLLVIIPPCQQGPPSRSSTPAASAPGASTVPLMAHSSMTHIHVPPQPWGLPPDAALLSTSFGSGPLGTWNSGSKGYRAATTGGITAPSPRQSFSRWSAGGVAEQRSLLGQGSQTAGYSASRVTSPLLSETDAVATVIAGSEGAVLVPGQSRPVSSTEAAIAAAIDEQAPVGEMGQVKDAFFEQMMYKRQGFFPIPPHVRGWARVRWAYHSKELFDLPRRESYDVVSATFKRLFPHEFDRAIPVINHRGVDKLLLQWEAAVGALERAEMKRRRTGREPLRLTGMCGPLLGCCAESIACGCCPFGTSCVNEDSGDCWPAGSAVKIIPELQVCLLAATAPAGLDRGRHGHKQSMLLVVLNSCACCPDLYLAAVALQDCQMWAVWFTPVCDVLVVLGCRTPSRAWRHRLRRPGARPSPLPSPPAGLCCSRRRAQP